VRTIFLLYVNPSKKSNSKCKVAGNERSECFTPSSTNPIGYYGPYDMTIIVHFNGHIVDGGRMWEE
jgi:hypothetical protein